MLSHTELIPAPAKPTIFLDFDGTLAVSKSLVIEAINIFLTEKKLPKVTDISQIRWISFNYKC